jgi:bifunctional DNA-binding transcriptional regulator/antitoxin component of YhaV-PrlF toxin-antitoxin module
MQAVRAKVTANGQVSLPAALRRRWGASSVLVIDRGSYVIVRPIPPDPVAELKGAHAGTGPAAEEARRAERRAEADRERARSGRPPR